MNKKKWTKWTNELIDEELKRTNRSIKRIGNYEGARTPIEFLCLIEDCRYSWKARPDDLLNNETGCRQCANKMSAARCRLTVEKVSERFKDRGYKLLGEYKNGATPILTQHMECGFKWSVRANDIFSGYGCPQCYQNLPFSQEVVIERYKEKGLELLGEYKNGATPILTKHTKCGYEWSPIPNNIFNGRGCPKCAGNLRITQEVAFQRYKENGFELIGEYKNDATPTLTKHIECGFEWSPAPNRIFRGGGCPECSLGRNEKLTGISLEQAGFVVNKQKPLNHLGGFNNKRMRFDFYLPEISVAIEYNGAQHYHPVCFGGISVEIAEQNFLNQQIRDQNKQQYCDYNNITLIWIDGRKYKGAKLKQYVQEIIIPQLQDMEFVQLKKIGACSS